MATWNIFTYLNRKLAEADNANSKKGLPMKRKSLPSDDINLLTVLKNQGPIPFLTPKKFPVEIYEILGWLTIHNPDLRQAVKHITELGNTGHLLTVEGDSDAAMDAIIRRLSETSARIFPYSAGIDGLVNSIFSQVARFGATATEWVPDSKLSRVEQVFVIPIRQIRWVQDGPMFAYRPVQKPDNVLISNPGAFVDLNPRTFHYMNLETDEDSPYAIPPFVAALGPVAIQKIMTDNIRKIVKKLGIMGMLTYSVEPPAQKPGESDAEYNQRCLKFLDEMATQVQGTFAEGLAMGFKGAFEFDVQSVTGDARGVADIFNLNEQQLFSGIGSDPAMHGRTYATTETYASVMYSKMISQLRNTQMLAAHTLEFGFNLDLLLAGIPAKNLKAAFRPSEALNNLQESQAEMIDIANASALYKEGVIDQNEKARRLGYQKPALPEPMPDPSLAQDKNLNQRNNTGGGPDNDEKASKSQPKQPKESYKIQLELSRHGAYKQVVDMHYLELNGKPMPVKTVSLADGEGSEPDPVVDNHYRRYLRRDPGHAGCC